MMRDEYGPEHFKDAVRGKYADRYRSAKVKVILDPEVAAVFADDEAVNEALRTLIRLRASAAGTPGASDSDLQTGA